MRASEPTRRGASDAAAHSTSVAAPAESFTRRAAIAVGLSLAGLVVAALFIIGIDILLAAFGGVLFAVLLRAATDGIARYTPVPDAWAYVALLVAATLLLSVGAVLLYPALQDQVERASEQMPQIVAEVEQYLRQTAWGEWILERAENGGGGEAAQSFLGAAGGMFTVLGNWFYYFLTAFFVGLFAAAKPRLYLEGTAAFFPFRRRERVLEALHELGYTLRRWLLGQLFVMTIIGVSTWLVLWFFNVPLAPLLGVTVGLLGFIPYLGPIIGVIPITLVAGTQGVETLLYVLAAYTAVQLIEGYVINPMIHHKLVYLPPVFTIVAQVLLGSILGILGFVLATPLAAVFLVLSRFYREDVLGETGAVAARGDV